MIIAPDRCREAVIKGCELRQSTMLGQMGAAGRMPQAYKHTSKCTPCNAPLWRGVHADPHTAWYAYTWPQTHMPVLTVLELTSSC